MCPPMVLGTPDLFLVSQETTYLMFTIRFYDDLSLVNLVVWRSLCSRILQKFAWQKSFWSFCISYVCVCGANCTFLLGQIRSLKIGQLKGWLIWRLNQVESLGYFHLSALLSLVYLLLFCNWHLFFKICLFKLKKKKNKKNKQFTNFSHPWPPATTNLFLWAWFVCLFVIYFTF